VRAWICYTTRGDAPLSMPRARAPFSFLVPVRPSRSCAAIEAGENALAADFLQRAETLGRENELDEDDSAVLKCQRAYLDFCSGDKDAAIASFKVRSTLPASTRNKSRALTPCHQSILSSKPSDHTVVVVAQNNLIVGSRDRKAYDSIKALRAAYSENVKYRLTAKQNRSIDMNMLLLLMSGGAAELEQCRKLCSVKASSLDAATASVKATLLHLEKKTDAAIALLKPFLANGPLSLKLLSAQMSIHQNDLPAAVAILDSLVKDDTLRLGIVSALCKLHVAAGDTAAAIATIDATIKRAKRGHGLWPLIQDAVRLHEQAGNVQSAAAALEKYSNSGPRKNITLAHLVELTARFDSDKAEKLSLGLPPLPTDPSIDVDALENSSSRRGAASHSLAAEANPSRKGGAVDAERTARIRVRRKAKKIKALKKKLGSSFNPKHQADVNKWLPYADRPGVKRRNWKKDAVRGSQGTAAPAASTTPAAAAAVAAVAAPAAAGAAPQKKGSKGRR
jgi:hypothetical protein